LVEHVSDINKEDRYDEIILFDAFESGNEVIIKFLVEPGTKLKENSKPIFFIVTKSLIKYMNIF
ncbi:ankyrin, partial [Neocallimastix lanati (nom. inval.)]